jgi:hypothetical protein
MGHEYTNGRLPGIRVFAIVYSWMAGQNRPRMGACRPRMGHEYANERLPGIRVFAIVYSWMVR